MKIPERKSVIDALRAVRARHAERRAKDEADHKKLDAVGSPTDKKKSPTKPKRKIERPMTGIVIPKDAPRWLAMQIERRVKGRVRERSRLARRRGRISATACQMCGVSVEKTKLELHHDDYSKSDVVRVFCRPCHRKHHWDRGELAE